MPRAQGARSCTWNLIKPGCHGSTGQVEGLVGSQELLVAQAEWRGSSGEQVGRSLLEPSVYQGSLLGPMVSLSHMGSGFSSLMRDLINSTRD